MKHAIKTHIAIQCWDDHEKVLIVAVFKWKIIGSVCVNNYEHYSLLHSLYVDEAYRLQGVSSLMLDEVDKYAKFKPINVILERNAPDWLITFYVKRGYFIQ